MSPRPRVALLAAAFAALALPAWHTIVAMPRFDDHRLPYGDAINAAAPAGRRVTKRVSAVNFDYRGFDTLGEEMMLLAAITGTAVLLRSERVEEERQRLGPPRAITGRSEAVTLVGRIAAPVTLLFGRHVALHATVTPGAGFRAA